ncbi:MAG: hypothetical protein K8U57_17590 [Planctomycetes bacterium]|nr:hypothetical protein [Planctomycetota bacterium]
MSELTEKDPCLKRILDKRTGRNLLEDVHPLEANPTAGTKVTVTVRIENGAEAPIELVVTTDRDWLKPSREKLYLMGGETGEFDATVTAAGTGEFANLCFAWSGATETYREYVLVWRKGKSEQPAAASPKNPTGITAPPDWMKR